MACVKVYVWWRNRQRRGQMLCICYMGDNAQYRRILNTQQWQFGWLFCFCGESMATLCLNSVNYTNTRIWFRAASACAHFSREDCPLLCCVRLPGTQPTGRHNKLCTGHVVLRDADLRAFWQICRALRPGTACICNKQGSRKYWDDCLGWLFANVL